MGIMGSLMIFTTMCRGLRMYSYCSTYCFNCILHIPVSSELIPLILEMKVLKLQEL